MGNGIFLNNQKYISAKEASLISGYSQDYIGQLARANKIKSHRVGRVWYVTEESVLNYKNLPLTQLQDIVSSDAVPATGVNDFLKYKKEIISDPYVKGNHKNTANLLLEKSAFWGARKIKAVLVTLLFVSGATVFGQNILPISNKLSDLVSSFISDSDMGSDMNSLTASVNGATAQSDTNLNSSIDSFLSNYKKYLSTGKKEVASVVEKKDTKNSNKTTSTPVVVRSAVVSEKSVLSSLRSLLSKEIPEDILSKLRGPAGPQGAPGPQGVPGAIGYTFSATPPLSPNPSGPIGVIGGFANLGTQELNTKTLTASSDIVQTGGSSSLKSLSVSGTLSTTGNSTISGTLGVTGNASFAAALSVTGNSTFTGSITSNGQGVFTMVPTSAHSFVPSWPDGTSNVSNSTLYINPASAVADSNLLGLAVNGVPKFLVDAEGDIYGKNLILTGSTSTGATSIGGNLTVQDNTELGDAATDTVTISGPTTIGGGYGSTGVTITAAGNISADGNTILGGTLRVGDTSTGINNFIGIHGDKFANPNPLSSFGKDVTNPLVADSFYNILSVAPTITQNADIADGYINAISPDFTVNGTGDFSGITAIAAYAKYAGSGDLNDGVYGLAGGGIISGGTAVSLIGAQFYNQRLGGTVTDIVGVDILGPSTTGGSSTNSYGLRVADQSGSTNNYSIYTNQSAGANNYAYYGAGAAKSYFGGSVGIGTTVPTASLDVYETGLYALNVGQEYADFGNTYVASFGGARGASYFSAKSVLNSLNVDAWGGASFINQNNTAGGITYGAFFIASATGSSPASSYGGYSEAVFDVGGTGTLPTNIGHYFSTQNFTASGNITNNYQIYVETANNLGTSAGTITNSYGVYVADQTNATNNFAIYTNQTAGANNYALYNAGTAKSYFGGSVGIGTNNPAQKLELSGTGNTALRIVSTDGGASFPLIQFNKGGVNANLEYDREGDGYWGIGTNAGGDVKFRSAKAIEGDIRIEGTQASLPLFQIADTTNSQTWNIENGRDAVGNLGFYNGGTKMVLDSSGNLGIGTTSPSQLLEVSKSQNALTQAQVTNATNGTSGRSAFTAQMSTAGNGGLISMQAISPLFTAVSTWANTGAIVSGISGGILLSAFDASAPIIFQTGGNSASNERMRILSNGNVGIGTTEPSYKLHVVTTTASDRAIWTDNTATTGNNYGVGAQAYGSGATLNVGLYAYATGATTNQGIKIAGPASGANNWALYSDATAQSYFAGNVGIGTVSPGSALDVKGTLRLSGATSGYVGFAPAAVAGSTTYTLPSADGTSGQVLTTNGSGVLSWTTKTEGLSQTFKGLSLSTSRDDSVANYTVTLNHADEIVMDTGNRVTSWDDLSASIASSGAGGLDTGAEAASTWYEIYAIRKSSDSTKNLLLHRAKDYFLDESQTTDDTVSVLREGAGTQTKIAQTFDTDVSGVVEFVDLKLIKNGSPAGQIWAELYATSGGTPTGAVLATSDKIDASLISTSSQIKRFIFRSPISLTAGTTYALVLGGNYTLSDANNIRWRTNSAGGYAAGSRYEWNGSAWANAGSAVDAWFKIYVTENDSSVTMPSGYDQKALVGYVYNDSGSNFDKFTQVDHKVDIQTDGYTSGVVSSTQIIQPFDLSTSVPPGSVNVKASLATNAESAVGSEVQFFGISKQSTSVLYLPIGIGDAADRAYAEVVAEENTEYQAIHYAPGGRNGYFRIMGYTWGSSGGADVAEEYLVQDETINAGDVVSVSPQGSLYIERADINSTQPVFGIVSTKPGLRLSDFNPSPDNNRAVALNGRVPVKVTNENGEIKVGDRITLSKTVPGYAMKQTESGQSIGIALEGTNNNVDKILVFVNLTYWTPGLEKYLVSEDGTSSGNSFFDSILSLFKNAFEIVFKKGYLKVANIVSNLIKTDNLEVKGTGITIYDRTTKEPYCVGIDNGLTVNTPGPCENIAPEIEENIVDGSSLTSDVILSTTDNTGSGDTNNSNSDTPIESNTPIDSTSSDTPPTDTTPPVITLNGDNVINITLGTIYEELGATATDDTDGSVPVVVTGSVDVNTLGSYTINYNTTDSSNNNAVEVTRTVNVVE